jgi:hypothetical protein
MSLQSNTKSYSTLMEMASMTPEEMVPITPVNFFQICVDCAHLDERRGFPILNRQNCSKYLLPDTSALCSEYSFAQVAIGWHREGVEIFTIVNKPFQIARYPEVDRGDSVEIFIDTRDVKTSGFNTRFCHHFFFLPESIEGHSAGEITRFRTEDTHPLCDSEELLVECRHKETFYTLNICIPTQCMYGYDPDQFDRMGFAYRINRNNGFPQHFSVVTDDYQLEQQPSLWSSLKLIT